MHELSAGGLKFGPSTSEAPPEKLQLAALIGPSAKRRRVQDANFRASRARPINKKRDAANSCWTAQRRQKIVWQPTNVRRTLFAKRAR